MRLLFLGSGAFGLPSLERLAHAHTIVGVVTQPDRPAGRSRKPTPTPIGDWAMAHLPDAPLFKPEDANDPGVVASLHALDADAWVVIAFGQKLSPALLGDHFAINLHASLLPRWRGAAPINWAMIAGDASSGNSVITIAQRMDAGLVLGSDPTPIDPSETAGELHDRLAERGPALLERVLLDRERGTLEPCEQDESLVTRARKLSRADGWVDFSQEAEACRARIHGLTPWPGVTVALDGQPLKLLRVKASTRPGEQSAGEGTLLDAAAGVVACGGGTALEILEVQPPGKRPMAWGDFVRGRPVRDGDVVQGGDAC